MLTSLKKFQRLETFYAALPPGVLGCNNLLLSDNFICETDILAIPIETKAELYGAAFSEKEQNTWELKDFIFCRKKMLNVLLSICVDVANICL